MILELKFFFSFSYSSMMEGELEKEKTRFNVMEQSLKDSLAKLTKELEKMEGTLELQRAIIVSRK